MPPLDAEAAAVAARNRTPSSSPPPLWGRDREGGIAEQSPSGFPPPLTPPHVVSETRLRHDGEGDSRTATSSNAPQHSIWHAGAFHPDTWIKADATSALPEGPVLVPKKRWLAERGQLLGRNAAIGLIIAAGEAVDDIAADLPRFALIALDFPKFSDGRAFSTARLLREKHGYTGELRAIGNVLADQIPFMRRVGFDSFEITHGPTRRALAEGRLAEVTLHYQPAVTVEPPAGTRPWLRHKGR